MSRWAYSAITASREAQISRYISIRANRHTPKETQMAHHIETVKKAMAMQGYGRRAAESVALRMAREGYFAADIDDVISWTARNAGRW